MKDINEDFTAELMALLLNTLGTAVAQWLRGDRGSSVVKGGPRYLSG